MVANENILGTPYYEDDDDPDLPAATYGSAVSLGPRGVGRFATTGARDTAYAAAIAGTTPYNTPQKGMRCYVDTGPNGNYGDWCGWKADTSEWIWDHPVPQAYNSGSIAGTSVNYSTISGHNPSVYEFTPSRSGYATVRVYVAAEAKTTGYGVGYLRPRFSSGTLLPGGTSFTVINNLISGTRHDADHIYPVPIYLTKNVTTTLAFDVWSFSTSGGGYWDLVSAQWQITQI